MESVQKKKKEGKNKRSSKEKDIQDVQEHGPKYEFLHSNTAGIYFIKEEATEMVLKVVSSLHS